MINDSRPIIALAWGAIIVILIVAVRGIFGLTMAQTTLAGAVLFFASGYKLGSASAKQAAWRSLLLAGPYFIIGGLIVLLRLANVFFVLPVTGLLSAFLGLLMGNLLAKPAKVAAGGVAGLWLALSAMGYYFISPAFLAHKASESLHEPAPAFALQTLAGEPFSSDSLQGRVVLIDFWATWCAPCLRQFPEIQQLYDSFGKDGRVTFLVVNTSWSGDTVDKAKAFMRTRGFAFPVYYDAGGKVARKFGITSIPHTLLIDRDGNIRMRHTGALPEKGRFYQDVSARIKTLLAGK